MTPEQKWLLLHGSGWVDWVDVMNSKALDVFENEFDPKLFEIDPIKNQVRLKQYESIRVHVAPSAGVHTI